MNPTLQLLLRTLHLLSVILWMGGVVLGGLVVGLATDESKGGVVAAVRNAARSVITPAMVVAWLAGLALLLDGWTTLYARAGWMHGKVTVALIASGLTGVLMGRLRKGAGNAAEVRPRVFLGLAAGLGLCALLVVSLAKFRFGT